MIFDLLRKRREDQTQRSAVQGVMANELRFVLAEEPTSLRTVFGGASLVHIALLIVLVVVGWLRPGQQPSRANPDLGPGDRHVDRQSGRWRRRRRGRQQERQNLQQPRRSRL